MAQSLSTTQQLLLACARVEIHQAGSSRVGSLLREHPVDWRQFIGEATAHGIFPLVCRNLKQTHGALIPPSVLRLLELKLRRSTVRNMALTCELIEIVDLLSRHGIRAIPFKGPVLSAALYGSPCLREFSDLDVLVDRCDGIRAVALLASHGYAKALPAPSDSPNGSHHALVCRGTGATLELQWDLGSRWGLRRSASREALCFDDVWRHRETVAVGCRSLPSPCAEDLALMLSVHASRHLWSRLVWISDFAALAHTRTGINWQRVERRAKRYQCSRRLWIAQCLAAQLLDLEQPGPVRVEGHFRPRIQTLAARLQRSVMDLPNAGEQTSDRARLARDLDEISLLSALPDDWMERVRMRLHYLIQRIPPNALDRRVANLPRPLHAGYCVIRPLRLIWTYLQPR